MRALRGLAVFVGYLALTIAFTWPLWPLRNSWLCGDQELPAFMFRGWWMRNLAADAWTTSSGFGDKVAGVLLSGHFPEAGNLTDMFWAWPLQDVFGYPFFHNLKLVLIVMFNALGGYAAARIVLRDRCPRAAAFVGGAVVAFNPYVVEMINIGRLREATLGFVALSAALGWRLVAEDEGRPWYAVLAGATWAMAANFYWFYAHFVFLWMCIAVTWRVYGFIRKGGDEARPPFRIWARNIAIALWTMLLLILPTAAPHAVQGDVGEGSGVQYSRTVPTLEELQTWREPNDLRYTLLHSQQRMLVESFPPEYLFGFDRPDGLALLVVLLAAAALALCLREALPWALGAGLFWSLSLGPYLQWGGKYLKTASGDGIPLPHAFLYCYLPVFSRLYAPNRAAVMLMVCLGVLCAMALAAAFRRVGSGRWERMAVGVLCVLGILGPMWMSRQLPLRFIPARLAAGYQWIGAQPPLGAVLEMPAESNRDVLNFNQITHQHALVGGWATRGPAPLSEHWLAVGASIPREVAHALDNGVTREALQLVASYGVRFIVVHERFYVYQDPGRGGWQYRELCQQLDSLLGGAVTREQEPAPEFDGFMPPGFLPQPPTEREMRVYDLSRLGTQ